MPQLDTTWFASQFFWLCICFFFMYFVVAKFIAPKIADILQMRQKKIDDYLDRAAVFKQQAEDTLKAYQSALASATAQADESLLKQKNDLANIISKKTEDMQKSLGNEIAKSEALIEKNKDEALAQIDKTAEDLANLIVKKLGV